MPKRLTISAHLPRRPCLLSWRAWRPPRSLPERQLSGSRACPTPIGTLGLIGSPNGLRELRWSCDGIRTAFDLPLDLGGGLDLKRRLLDHEAAQLRLL